MDKELKNTKKIIEGYLKDKYLFQKTIQILTDETW